MNYRSVLVFLHDLACGAVAWGLAYLLRFNFDIPTRYWLDMQSKLWMVLGIEMVVFWMFGLNRGLWRFTSLPDVKRILSAAGLIAVLLPTLLYMTDKTIPPMTGLGMPKPVHVPRSVIALYPLLLMLFIGASRFFYRVMMDGPTKLQRPSEASPVLVMGAGSAASMLLRELANHSVWRVVGLLDDDPAKKGRHLLGIPVLGNLAEVGEIAKRLETQQVIIAMPSAAPRARRLAMEVASNAGLAVLTVPVLDDLLSGRVSIAQIHKVELDDLLGREPVTLDTEGMHEMLTGKVVMVTGAGGSIGSELCRQIAAFQPSLLVLFEANEYAIYNLEQEFQIHSAELMIVCAVGDVKDRLRVEQVIRRYAPTIIFHAAAYKHVPMMEKINAWEAIRNNSYGTYVVARAAIDTGVGKFVLVSTDKAVNPTNIMGASKRLAEMICQALQPTTTTRFEMVRFGNVLGSTGSVIPKFREQIARGGPVTVTHPDIIRYFMSIPEAAQLVLQAGAMGEGGEIFVLDMGEPVKIVDLARDMIRLSGFQEDEIKIEFSGLRPGEKLYEELLADDEHTGPTPHPKLRIAMAREVDGEWLRELLDWLQQPRIPGDEEIRRDLKRWVPEYRPSNRPVLKVVRNA